MAKTVQTNFEYDFVLPERIKTIFYGPDDLVFDRYLVQLDEPINYTDELFKKEFLQEVDRLDSKNKRIYSNLKLIEGINLSYFYTVLVEEVKPLLPENYKLNFETIFTDMEQILEANKKEVLLARTNRKSQYATKFVMDASDFMGTDMLTDKAFKYMADSIIPTGGISY